MKPTTKLITLIYLILIQFGCLTSGGGGGTSTTPGSNATVSINSPLSLSKAKLLVSITGSCSTSGTLNISGDTSATTTICTNNSFSVNVALNGSDGLKTIQVSDGTSNASITLIKDNIAPTISYSPSLGTSFGSTVTSITGSCTEDSTLNISYTNGSSGPTSSTCTLNGGFQFNVQQLDSIKSKSITITASDSASNISSQLVHNYNYYKEPIVTLSTPTTNQSVSSTITFSGTCESSAKNIVVSSTILNAVAQIGCSNNSFSTTLATNGNEGTHNIQISQSDELNRISTITRSVIKDTVSPVITINSPTSSTIITNNYFTASGTCESNRTVSIQYGSAALSGTVSTPCLGSSFTSVVNVIGTSATTSLSVTQLDLAGNQGSSSQTIVISINGTWTSINMTNRPTFGYGNQAIWTGSKMLVLGGRNTGDSNGELKSYDPSLNTWTTLATNNFDWISHYRAIWTGTDLIYYGGCSICLNDYNYAEDFGKYNLGTNTWTQIVPSYTNYTKTGHSVIWTGTKMIEYGGGKPGIETSRSGGIYDPANGTTTFFAHPVTSGTNHLIITGHHAVWTGSRMLIWGKNSSNIVLGYLYNPDNDSWTMMSSAPDNDVAGPNGVWTGNEFLVYSGWNRTGKKYNPTTDSWTIISAIGSPKKRSGHVNVWTGSKLIVFGGGEDSSTSDLTRNTGGIYDLATNSWLPMSTINAPQLMYGSAVWTGTQMIVWGVDANYQAVGGIYTP